jgi:hypothetical protein
VVVTHMEVTMSRKARARRLADMSAPPPSEPEYLLPPPDECEEYTWPVLLPDASQWLIVRLLWWNNRIVDFAVMQAVREDGQTRIVAKIDCDGGVIHRHQYTRDDQDLWGHRLIRRIPSGWT